MHKKIIFISLITAELLLGETLPVITVDADQDSSSTEISATKINRTQIDNSIQGNGFISSLLETNPNVKVTDESRNSNTAGEITPGKISINEAPFYQNNFQIDGISNNSLMDPNLSNPNDPYDVPGNENEIFLDLDLVDSIFIYDSNISAEYGNFTGGVIDAKTIRAGSEPSYKISYGHTSDKLTSFHVKNKESFESANSDNKQAKFEKNFFSMYANTPIDEENGIIISYNRKESIIPGAYFGGFVDKKRLNQSLFTKWSHYFEDDSVLDITGTYSPYESTHIQEYVKDSYTKIKGGGASLKANYEKDYDFWNFKSNLAFKYSENSKESLNYNKQWLNQKDKTWGNLNPDGSNYSNEGGTGSIDKNQEGLAYNLKLISSSFKTGDISHVLKTGFSLDYNRAEYNRKNNMYYYNNSEDNYRIDCNGNTEDCSYSDQYFTQRRVYKAENATANILATAFYFEDKLNYDFIEFTPGLRFDYNNYLKNLDIAYRLNTSVKPFGNDKTVIYGGFNRYYGKSFLGYKLREARAPYYDEERSAIANVVGDWETSSDKDSTKYVFSDLDTPYTDEASLGIKQDFLGMRVNLKYVNRDSKSEFSKEKGEYKVYTRPDGVTKGYYRPTYFTNGGYSESKIITLNLGPTKALEFPGFNLGYNLSTSWKNTSSNIDTYDDILEDEDEDDINKVYYNGQYYDKNKLAIKSKPKNVKLHLNFAFQSINILGVPTRINLNNVIKYNLAYSDIFQADEDDTVVYKETLPDGSKKEYEVDVYEKVDFDASTTLDLKASFDFKISGKQHLLLNTEINNVFDTVQNVESSKTNYKIGRQFWVNIAYKF